MVTFHCINFGCRASQADGAALKKQLLDAGFLETGNAAESQLAVVNTCTVTSAADAEARQAIRRLHRANPNCRILVTGCYAQRAPREIAELPGVAWVIGNSHKHAIVQLVKAAQPSFRVAESAPSLAARGEFGRSSSQPPSVPAPTPERAPAQVFVGEIPDIFHFAPVFADDRTRPTLKIQDGCDARCSFCVIPLVRGASRSLPPDRVIQQVRELSQQGFQEIVLSGINLGSYGKDLTPRMCFDDLLEGILKETSIPRIRISSIEPMDVTERLVELLAAESRMAEHLHVPLQSGCDRILRLMNRRYWTAQYAERILKVHERMPHCAIGADVMAGFPGETEKDHVTSLQFIESLPLAYLHVFPYSSRPATAAAAMPAPVDGRVIHNRCGELLALSRSKRRAFAASQVGRRVSVLTLDDTAGGERLGMTGNYLKVLLPLALHPPNRMLEVRLARVQDDVLSGFVEGC